MANFVARPMEYIVGWLLTSGLCILDRYLLSVYILYSCPRPRTICGVTSWFVDEMGETGVTLSSPGRLSVLGFGQGFRPCPVSQGAFPTTGRNMSAKHECLFNTVEVQKVGDRLLLPMRESRQLPRHVESEQYLPEIHVCCM